MILSRPIYNNKNNNSNGWLAQKTLAILST